MTPENQRNNMAYADLRRRIETYLKMPYSDDTPADEVLAGILSDHDIHRVLNGDLRQC